MDWLQTLMADWWFIAIIIVLLAVIYANNRMRPR